MVRQEARSPAVRSVGGPTRVGEASQKSSEGQQVLTKPVDVGEGCQRFGQVSTKSILLKGGPIKQIGGRQTQANNNKARQSAVGGPAKCRPSLSYSKEVQSKRLEVARSGEQQLVKGQISYHEVCRRSDKGRRGLSEVQRGTTGDDEACRRRRSKTPIGGHRRSE
ncbi:hypothetical protein Acr_09g0003490 [Actinidia rufa]|uniref:Uncharacterized protein n=1 Tax=Actinidia rufa TaxID=165716 RepID=A0A7J0F5M6_9ERIC|nr:hypothetical protein Acr_09g0003490 [Actinidia rufa]